MTGFESLAGDPRYERSRVLGGGRSLRSLRRPLRSIGKLLALVILLGAGLAVASQMAADHSAPQTVPHPSSDSWLAIMQPLPLFGLSGTDFAKLPLDYAAVRHSAGGGRRDILMFGDPQGDQSWLKLSLYRIGAEATSTRDDLADMVQGFGFEMTNSAEPTLLATRFGSFEAADMRIGAPSGPRPCLGFRSMQAPDAALRVEGLACGSLDHPMGRDLLSCVIDRIDLLSAGDDQALRDIFVEAERRRGAACMPSRLTPSASHVTWLDANSAAPTFKPLSIVVNRR